MDRRNIPYGSRNGAERRGTVSSVTVLLPEEVDEYTPTIVFNGHEGLGQWKSEFVNVTQALTHDFDASTIIGA